MRCINASTMQKRPECGNMTVDRGFIRPPDRTMPFKPQKECAGFA
jgi:hypothetical protein